MSTDNCLPVGLTGTEVAALLTFFMSACKYHGSDGQTLQLWQKTWRRCTLVHEDICGLEIIN